MSDLTQIPNASDSSLELLEAAGFRYLKEIAGVSEQALVAELERANEVLKITDQAPDPSAIADWVSYAREVMGAEQSLEAGLADPARVRAYEVLPDAPSLLGSEPFAIPMPTRLLEKQGLLVSDIPEGFPVSRQQLDPDVQMDKRVDGEARNGPFRSHVPIQSVAVQPAAKSDMDFSKLKSFDDMGDPLLRQPGSAEEIPDERVALIRAPRVETNKGVDPSSRRYIRGVLHSHPLRIFSGAIITLLLMVLIPVALVSAILLLLSRERAETLGWVQEWWLVFPLALPLVGLFWAFLAYSGACRICGQKLFIHRSHRKNAKAHHIPFLGYVFPLCIHILLFRWFRCTHCGTPVRLKK